MPSAARSPALVAGLILGVTLPHPAVADDEDRNPWRLGGAARFNYGWLDYGPDKGDGNFDLELLRVDAGGSHGPLFFSLQYRWYEDFDAIHHAWIGWRVDKTRDLRAGVVKVPFGLLPYASHSFWFGSGYYLGIEDDYDLGAVWRDAHGDRRWHLALFAGDEYRDGTEFDRYSFDVATTGARPYREAERAHLRYARDIGGDGWRGEVGVSGFVGRIDNRSNDTKDTHWGAALHTEMERGRWSLQLQWARYDYGVDGERIALSAFRFPFEIAAEADVLSANLAYDLPWTGGLDGITCYNDLSTTQVDGKGLDDSWQNVSGCSFAKGPMFTYVDWIAGRNMWFVGGPGVGIHEPGGDRWRSRLNINLGLYF
jgi:hypothetical protein